MAFNRSGFQSLWTRYAALPEGLPKKSVRAYKTGLYAWPLALAWHALFVMIFTLVGEPVLAVYNIASVLVDATIVLLNRRGRINAAMILWIVEVNIFVSLCVYLIGWNTGFQFWLYCVIVSIFLNPSWKTPTMVILATANAVYIVPLYFYSRHFLPLSIQPEFVVGFLAMFNIMCVAVSISIITYYYVNAVVKVEAALEREYDRSESLLLNILPRPIAQRLKEHPGSIADKFDHCTILFADIVSFTQLSETISPEALVELLNRLFLGFDILADKYGVEKIKTIGDAYMAATGIPVPRAGHAAIMADMALEMMDQVRQFKYENQKQMRMRIGMHSGPAIAGVIGSRKFSYDLWGDTVNTASRMESHGTPCEIQVSESTRVLLGNDYAFSDCYTIDFKGKGPMKAYLLKGRA